MVLIAIAGIKNFQAHKGENRMTYVALHHDCQYRTPNVSAQP